MLHTNYIIHRDIKGENVMVTTQGDVKLGMQSIVQLPARAREENPSSLTHSLTHSRSRAIVSTVDFGFAIDSSRGGKFNMVGTVWLANARTRARVDSVPRYCWTLAHLWCRLVAFA